MRDYIKTMRKYIGHERLIVVGAGVVIHKNGKVLLQKRKDNGCWAMHGGGLEPGETTEETAKRELFEETGLVANALEFAGVFSGPDLLYTYPNGDMVAIIAVAYLCDDFCGEMKVNADEATDLQWFDIDDLPESISSPDIPVLKKCTEILKRQSKL